MTMLVRQRREGVVARVSSTSVLTSTVSTPSMIRTTASATSPAVHALGPGTDWTKGAVVVVVVFRAVADRSEVMVSVPPPTSTPLLVSRELALAAVSNAMVITARLLATVMFPVLLPRRLSFPDGRCRFRIKFLYMSFTLRAHNGRYWALLFDLNTPRTFT